MRIYHTFVKNQNKMLENNRNLLGYEEYRLHVYENINKVIVITNGRQRKELKLKGQTE